MKYRAKYTTWIEIEADSLEEAKQLALGEIETNPQLNLELLELKEVKDVSVDAPKAP